MFLVIISKLFVPYENHLSLSNLVGARMEIYVLSK